MLIPLLALTTVVLVIALIALALNMNLYKHNMQQNYRKSPTTQLHEIIFLQHQN